MSLHVRKQQQAWLVNRSHTGCAAGDAAAKTMLVSGSNRLLLVGGK
jgi:hypothetical protein